MAKQRSDGAWQVTEEEFARYRTVYSKDTFELQPGGSWHWHNRAAVPPRDYILYVTPDTPEGEEPMIVEWPDIENVLEVGLHTILHGPPGTGKTYAGIRGPQAQSYAVTLTAETPAAELRGHYIPHGDQFQWHDGPCIRAWREGARIVLNEIDQASGDALTFLYVLLDDPDTAKLTLPTGETVRPKAGFQAVATTNANPMGALPAALLDRFSVRMYVDKPHPQALAKLPKALANAVKGTINKPVGQQVSLRQANALMALRATMGKEKAKLAARAVFGNRSDDVLNAMILALSTDAE